MRRPSIVWGVSIAAVAVAVTLWPAPARAQTASDPLDDLVARTSAPVFITTVSGTERFGYIARVEPDAVVLVVQGKETRIPRTDIARVQARGDSLTNGALTGAAIGATVSILYMRAFDCSGCLGSKSAFVFYATALYASIGTGLDALYTGRRTLYRRPRAQPSVRFGVGAGPRGEVAAHGGLAVAW